MNTLQERFDASQCKGGCHPTGCMCSVVEDALAKIERLTAALEQVRGFAAIMADNNWLDCKLYIERQCSALDTVDVEQKVDGGASS
jgi:ferredoxin